MLDKHFDFARKEAEIYARWEKAGVFKMGEVKDGEPVFNITMPPPNANGELHIGHCYGYAVMDVLGRYYRLKGVPTLLLPGKDHAGIQTQVVFEKKLRDEGVDVAAISREEFYKKCYDFCTDRSAYMRGQEQLIGTSADYQREVFTLDPRVSATVYDTFVKMYADGLVYRGSRMVNWSVFSQTSISDVEVEYKEEKGHLWHLKYALAEKIKRPERKKVAMDELGEISKMVLNAGNHKVILASASNKMLADLKIGEVIVEKHLKEELEIERDWVVFGIHKFSGETWKEEDWNKYSEEVRRAMQKNQGTQLMIDLVPDLDQNEAVVVATTRPETMLGDTAVAVNPADPRYAHLVGKEVMVPIVNRRIKIIADDRIDIGFGTGAVKITPAHDFLDNQIGKDHGLEEIQVIDKYGKMTEAAGKAYQDSKTLDCRAKLIKDLDEAGVLLLTEEIVHKVPISERGKDIVEPLISKQWFVAVDKEGQNLKKRALDLINSGRIKVYPARSKAMIVQWLENLNDWNISRQIMWGHQMPVWYKNKDQDNEEIMVGVDQPSGDGWVQETDTFDTWFSSGQWAYSTLAAEGLLDLNDITNSPHFPTHTMVMGRDILLFWACRMLLLSAYRLNEIPWKNIYFTGLIRDAKGQKMSKSKGNGVEPTEVLKNYGADALRVGLLAGSTAGLDVKFNEKKIEGYAKFVNKIWNAAKLIEMKVEGKYDWKLEDVKNLKLDSSKWILHELSEIQIEFSKRLDAYDLSGAFEVIYGFAWNTFCSWYLEIAKVQLDVLADARDEIKIVMTKAFEGVLQMLHVFMPFFTEEIYENMNRCGGEKMLAQSRFKSVVVIDGNEAKKQTMKIMDLVTAAREVRKVLERGFMDKLVMDFDFELDEQSAALVSKMVNVELAKLNSKEAINKPFSSGLIMIQASAEDKLAFKVNLENTLGKKTAEKAVIERILTPGFKAKADADLVKEREDQFELLCSEIKTLESEIAHN